MMTEQGLYTRKKGNHEGWYEVEILRWLFSWAFYFITASFDGQDVF